MYISMLQHAMISQLRAAVYKLLHNNMFKAWVSVFGLWAGLGMSWEACASAWRKMPSRGKQDAAVYNLPHSTMFKDIVGAAITHLECS